MRHYFSLEILPTRTMTVVESASGKHVRDGYFDTAKPGGHAAVRSRGYRPEDAELVCQWANEGDELELIASEAEDRLVPGIIDRWIAASTRTFVLELKGQPVAFATASTKEAPLPSGTVEICHLIVSPEHRRRYHGSFFCRWIARILVEGDGFRIVVGRVVPRNAAGLALMAYLRWKELPSAQEWTRGSGCRWFAAIESPGLR